MTFDPCVHDCVFGNLLTTEPIINPALIKTFKSFRLIV